MALFIALNGAGILLATTFAILQFDVSPWWYCAALAAWGIRIGSVYRTRSLARPGAVRPQYVEEEATSAEGVEKF